MLVSSSYLPAFSRHDRFVSLAKEPPIHFGKLKTRDKISLDGGDSEKVMEGVSSLHHRINQIKDPKARLHASQEAYQELPPKEGAYLLFQLLDSEPYWHMQHTILPWVKQQLAENRQRLPFEPLVWRTLDSGTPGLDVSPETAIETFRTRPEDLSNGDFLGLLLLRQMALNAHYGVLRQSGMGHARQSMTIDDELWQKAVNQARIAETDIPSVDAVPSDGYSLKASNAVVALKVLSKSHFHQTTHPTSETVLKSCFNRLDDLLPYKEELSGIEAKNLDIAAQKAGADYVKYSLMYGMVFPPEQEYRYVKYLVQLLPDVKSAVDVIEAWRTSNGKYTQLPLKGLKETRLEQLTGLLAKRFGAGVEGLISDEPLPSPYTRTLGSHSGHRGFTRFTGSSLAQAGIPISEAFGWSNL